MVLDAFLLHALNGIVGKSALVDTTVVFCASYLPWLLVVVFLGWLYFSQFPKKKKLYIFYVATLSALISRYGITELIRYFYQRPRPFVTYTDIHALFGSTEWSFPSGHATFFFALMSIVFLYDKKWGTWLLLATLLMAVGRVIAGVHYPSDILGGMCIGMFVAYTVFAISKRFERAEV